jgi:hypothetical protein
MSVQSTLRLPLIGLVSFASLPAFAQPGKIVLAHDEWTLSDGVWDSTDAATFAENLGDHFVGASNGDFYVWADGWIASLSGSKLASNMRANGHWWTVEAATTGTLKLRRLLNYDAVFISGRAVITADLIDYVLQGGNVYIAGGAGKVNEASAYNPFLQYFGLGFTTQNPFDPTMRSVTSDHPIFGGTLTLYDWTGTDVVDLDPTDGANAVLHSSAGHGLYAVFDCGLVAPGTSDLCD